MPLIGTPAGWLDRSHLVWQNQSEAARIDDLAASSDTAVLAAGFYARVLALTKSEQTRSRKMNRSGAGVSAL